MSLNLMRPPPVQRTPLWMSLLVVTICFLLFVVGLLGGLTPYPPWPIALQVMTGLAPSGLFGVGAWFVLRRRRTKSAGRLPALVEWSPDERRWHDGTRWRKHVSKKRAFGPPLALGFLASAVATSVVVSSVVQSGVSFNWSGYVATGHPFDSVQGTWTQPNLDCSLSGQGDFNVWVGLGGDSDGSVEQIGTAGECHDGKAIYAVWYEMAPANPIFIGSKLIAPLAGHVITASVKSAGQMFSLSIVDSTTGKAFAAARTTKSPVAQSSAEWIVEPSCHRSTAAICVDLPLVAFKPVHFSKCSATAVVNNARSSRQLGDWPSSARIGLDATAPRAVARPSDIKDGGFTITWSRA
jgi:hypothetical protein